MGGFSGKGRSVAAGDPTPALLGSQSHYFLDNTIALFGRIRVWNYSAETAIRDPAM
jgi:hypothetical protein